MSNRKTYAVSLNSGADRDTKLVQYIEEEVAKGKQVSDVLRASITHMTLCDNDIDTLAIILLELRRLAAEVKQMRHSVEILEYY